MCARAERVVPPRGLEPQPTTFAALRPILGTVANRSTGRSGGIRTLRSFALNERTGAWLTLPVIVSPEITAVSQTRFGIPGGNCTRTNGSRDRWTAVIQQGQRRASDRVGWRFLVDELLRLRQCAGALTRRLATRAVGTQWAVARGLVETACCFANWVAPGSLP